MDEILEDGVLVYLSVDFFGGDFSATVQLAGNAC